MKFEIFLSNGKVDKIETKTSENEEATIDELVEKVIYQIENLGFVCYDKGGAFRMINAKAIDEIRNDPDEKEK